MNAVTANTKTTLLLNNAWQPITVVTARAAFSHLHKKRITALDKNSNVFHSLDSWNSLGEYYDDQPFMRSVNAAWPIPTVIVVTSKFFRRPKKKKLTLFDLAKLCDYTCQYCFEKFPLKQLTIDHVNPRSRGGEDTHDNRVCCCRGCNLKKSNFIPYYDKNGKIPTPPSIPALMLNAEKIRPEWNYFLKNVY
jgi:5-methylcytosine-specific restriction endonuclease McrA